MQNKKPQTITPAKLLSEFLAINELSTTESVLFTISIHSMDEEVDPPQLSPSQQAHLLRLLQLITALKAIN
jgi:hypothetical protein